MKSENKTVLSATAGGGRRRFSVGLGQLTIPLIAIAILVIFNLIRDPGFFGIGISHNNDGNAVLSGNIITIINGASELAILAMGMTIVTAACGGQDISVGAAAAIAGSVFVKVLKAGPSISVGTVLLAFVFSCIVAMIFGAFNGTLVAVFRIQPMIATLILYTCGRSIAYWINGGATPTVDSPIIKAIGGFIPGIPVPTPVIIVLVMAILFKLLFRFTSLELFTQSVGINGAAARLNGINPTLIKLVSFIILGVCVSVSGCVGVSRLGLINHETLLLDIEMDAILAVAIGGNNLGGGKFRISGSIIGAYVIQMLTITLYAMKVPSTNVKAYKAIVIILLVVIGSPVVKARFGKWMAHFTENRKKVSVKGVEE
ncbi:MAG: ABC transporter permease [Lachnospiraceae bacterium]|nr:ABC transporter permease [Lachnospiraceae bacterium]